MIGRLLGSGELGKLASFVSPAFFEVMPAKTLWGKSRALWAQTRDSEAFRHAVTERSSALAGALPQVQMVSPRQAKAQTRPSALDHAARADLVTQLFFHQLFHDGPTLLDLRASAFHPSSNALLWHPARWITTWSPQFIGPLRDIYRGFYGRDDARFRQGLAALSLSHSEDLFRAQFGGDPRQMRFETGAFVRTFHQVFVRCKQAGTLLHADFLPLGIYLAALYDHLEPLDVPVDVGRAFARATRSPSADESEALHA